MICLKPVKANSVFIQQTANYKVFRAECSSLLSLSLYNIANGGTPPLILKLDTEWSWVVTSRTLLLHSGKRTPDALCTESSVGTRTPLDPSVKLKTPSPRPLYRKLCGYQNPLGPFGEVKNPPRHSRGSSYNFSVVQFLGYSISQLVSFAVLKKCFILNKNRILTT